MASSKQYAYYLEGNELAIVEKDVSFDNDVTSKEYGPGASRAEWNSPKTSVADGLEVKYVYSPNYRILDTSLVDTNDLTHYQSNGDGKLRFSTNVGSANFTNGTNVTNLSAVTHIVLENAGRFNGLHKLTSVDTTHITTDTPYSGLASATAFEEAVSMYYDVSVLEDEDFDLDLPLYLQKALVYYVKGKIAEDKADVKAREFFMREFKKMVEKYESSRISGLRLVSPGSHAMR